MVRVISTEPGCTLQLSIEHVRRMLCIIHIHRVNKVKTKRESREAKSDKLKLKGGGSPKLRYDGTK